MTTRSPARPVMKAKLVGLVLHATIIVALGWVQPAFAQGQPPPNGPAPENGPDAVSEAPDVKKQCSEAYVSAQRLRKAGRLLAAREQLLICSQQRCPDVLEASCVKWLEEVGAALPSIVIVAKDRKGEDTNEVRVYVDGELVTARLDGRPLVLDPGTHELRFEHEGLPAITRKILLQQGIRDRPVEVSWQPPKADSIEAPPSAKRVEPPPPATPVAAFVIAGIGLAALVNFAVFGILGTLETDDLNEGCGATGTCSEDDVEPTRTKLIVADVSLAVGAVGVAVGGTWLIYHYASAPDDDSPSVGGAVRVGVVPAPGGGVGLVSGTF